MNTNPDEVKLALWLDDELEGAELADFEQWIASQPEHTSAREESRQWRRMVAGALPAAEEPPYPDFFNTRVAKAIHDLERTPAPAAVPRRFWQGWLMPVAACAGMAATFWMGAMVGQPPAAPVVQGADPVTAPIVYVPEKGVDAEWFSSNEASATVIVLEGVAAIPDSTDFFSTAHVPMPRDGDRTAVLDTGKSSTMRQ
jgi:hypothetical protein